MYRLDLVGGPNGRSPAIRRRPARSCRRQRQISGSPKGPGNSAINLTIIATGSIKITGAPKFAPDNTGNPEKIQFITNGDLFIGGNVNADDPTLEEGQIFVKEQIHMHGNPSFQGRIIVQDDANVHDL